MSLVGLHQVFAAGCLGGIILELLHWYNLRRRSSFPRYARSVGYWLVTAAMAVSGGLLAVLYFGGRADGIIALHIGLTTPLILQKLTTTIATQPGGKGGGPSVGDFFVW